MVFNKIKCNFYSPLLRVIEQWVFTGLLLLYISDVQSAYTKKEIKNMPEKFGILMAVMKHKNKKYSTVSRTTGSLKYTVSGDPIPLIDFESRKVTLTLSTFKEFYAAIQPKMEFFSYLNRLPDKLTEYLDRMEVNTFNLNINLVVIPAEYKVFFESKKRSLFVDKLNLTFIVSDSEVIGTLKNQTATLEKNVLDIIPHEFFHLLDLYLSLIRTNVSKSLRKETYAELTGVCVAYEIYPVIRVRETKLDFPSYFFEDPDADLKKVRKKIIKKIKKGEFFNSKLSLFIARYYFQAVANNRTGKNIHSDKISKFCHKLFSEHNFKHPIEKKPPPWFKEFLETD